MNFSKDWGSTTTWVGILNILAATILLLGGHIDSTQWTAITGVSGGLVGVKGAVKAAKTPAEPTRLGGSSG